MIQGMARRDRRRWKMERGGHEQKAKGRGDEEARGQMARSDTRKRGKEGGREGGRTITFFSTCILSRTCFMVSLLLSRAPNSL